VARCNLSTVSSYCEYLALVAGLGVAGCSAKRVRIARNSYPVCRHVCYFILTGPDLVQHFEKVVLVCSHQCGHFSIVLMQNRIRIYLGKFENRARLFKSCVCLLTSKTLIASSRTFKQFAIPDSISGFLTEIKVIQETMQDLNADRRKLTGKL